ncbi:MAG: hypothetical protein J0L55_14435 [Caulobacterales bacterium]|nr:hypothetical protein [Caulobacterales bacterium]
MFHREIVYNQEIVFFLARFWGGVGLVMALLFLLKKDLLKSLLGEFDHLGSLATSLGFMSIMLGIGSIALYSKITFDWRMIITFFGWATLIKGVRILILPNALKDLIHGKTFPKAANIMIFIIGIISFYLLTKGL